MNNYMMRLIVLSVVFALAAVMPGCGKSDSSHSAKSTQVKKQKYHCPMHPTYVSDRPGDCPICNMKLVPFEEEGTVVSKKGQDMQMDVLAKDTNLPGVPNHVSIVLSPEKRQMIGLQVSPVEKREMYFALRTTARVEHDETRLAKISLRFNGWIRDLKVNFTGAPVEKGQPLFMVYSPELLTAEKEYVLALQNYEKQKDNPDQEQLLSAQRLLESSRRRLYCGRLAKGKSAISKRTAHPLTKCCSVPHFRDMSSQRGPLKARLSLQERHCMKLPTFRMFG